MDFTNEFTVDAPLATVWEFMLNAEEVAPCVPGAAITEQVDETHFKGTVKVKLGAVQMSYRGELEMVPNESDRTITLHAKGRETRGSGGASGTVTSRLVQVGEGQTRVEIHSHIDVTGKVAQFGRGIMQDVANRLIKDFARCLEQKITASASQAQAAGERETAERAPESAASASSTQSAPSGEAGPTTISAGPAPDAPPTPPGGGGPPPGQRQQASRAAPGSQPGSMTQSAAGTSSAEATPESASELRISQLVMDVFRSRAAGWLRSAANRIEPK